MGVFNRQGIFAVSKDPKERILIPQFQVSILQMMISQVTLDFTKSDKSIRYRKNYEIAEIIRKHNFDFPVLAAFGRIGERRIKYSKHLRNFNQDVKYFHYYCNNTLRNRVFIFEFQENNPEFLGWLRRYVKRM